MYKYIIWPLVWWHGILLAFLFGMCMCQSDILAYYNDLEPKFWLGCFYIIPYCAALPTLICSIAIMSLAEESIVYSEVNKEMSVKIV